MKERQLRLTVFLFTFFGALVFLTVLHFLLPHLPGGVKLARIFMARGYPEAQSYDDHYPFSVQNVEWIIFFIACGELWVRSHCTKRQEGLLLRHYLPEDETTMLRAKDLGPVYANLRSAPADSYMPRLIRRLILQYRNSKSSSETQGLLNSSVDMFMHEMDLRYSPLRYMLWLIPSLGFLGTVQGVGEALAKVGRQAADATNSAQMLPDATKSLAVAFDTTQVALLMASGLLLIMNFVQSREENMLNKTGQYVLDNLINRLCEPQIPSK